jgi:hypothetical protein
MYFMFLFLFGDQAAPLSHTRAVIWQAIHLPLHFCLLLLLSAMVVSRKVYANGSDFQNTIIVISFAHGIDTVTNEFSVSIDYMRNGTSLPQAQRDDIRRYLGRLSLEPR